MINKIKISNYKSLNELEIEPGRLNVIIGENGCGKSNFLEAVTLAGAASMGKLDNEFLANRGIRVTNPKLMRSNFVGNSDTIPIDIEIHADNESTVKFKLNNDNKPYSSWKANVEDSLYTEYYNSLKDNIIKSISEKISLLKENSPTAKAKLDNDETDPDHIIHNIAKDLLKKADSSAAKTDLNSLIKLEIYKDSEHPFSKFIIYSPENSALRNFYDEGQVEPLGVNGQGLLKLLQVISSTDSAAYEEIIESLKVFSWFKGFKIPDEFGQSNDSLEIRDKFTLLNMDQRSANEGFLFVLFYVALIVSSDTPAVFAIDNIDTSLNPKLCIKLTRLLSELSKKYNKQLFITTHNPAVLDGLDLNDDMQRLFVFNRNRHGHTKVKRITAENRPKSSTTKDYLNLSESMMRGYLKALPTNF